MIVRDLQTKAYHGIKCDVDGCEIVAPPAAEVLKGHGLNNMGWHCKGGAHYCPTHAEALK